MEITFRQEMNVFAATIMITIDMAKGKMIALPLVKTTTMRPAEGIGAFRSIQVEATIAINWSECWLLQCVPLESTEEQEVY